MDESAVPSHAIGRVGMVAQLQRVRPEHLGKLVAVRVPVGLMSSLSDNVNPVFAWQVLVLGQAVDLNGRPCQDIVVADRCLKPISQLGPGEVDALAKIQAEQAADEALADLRKILDAHPLAPDELDAFIEKAAEQACMERMLEVVPPAIALQDLDFRSTGTGTSGGWVWSGVYGGDELHVFAGPDLFGRWMLAGRHVSARQAMFDERLLADQEPRGKVVLQVLQLWRQAFGHDAPVPTHLLPALSYEQHLKEMRSLNIALPTLLVDGEVLRAVRRWLRQRHRDPCKTVDLSSDARLSLAYTDGLLRLVAGGQTYGCPAQGLWVGDCEVSLGEFLAIPVVRLRGMHIAMERSVHSLSVNGNPLGIHRDRP